MQDLMQEDVEEYKYRQLLMTKYIQVCLTLLKYQMTEEDKLHVYEAIEEILNKTHDVYGLSDVISS